MRNFLKVYVCVLFIFTACKHQKHETSNQILDSISIQESSCEGNCPVYQLTIYNNDKASFEGKLNVLRKGMHHYQFSKEEYADLFQLIAEINFETLKDNYESNIADLPEIVIIYREKQIVIKDLRTTPKSLKGLVSKLQELARSTGYIN